jgi:hypothetical protein
MPRLTKFLLDTTPRALYHFLNARWLNSKSLPSFNEHFPVIFVLSTGRVGTETLDALVQPLENIFSYHEPKPTLYRLSKTAYDHGEESLAAQILQEAFLTARTDLLQYSLDCHKGYVETSPQVTFLAPIILKLIPKVQFIHLVRDPRDVIRSGMRRKWFDGHPNDATRITPRPDSPHFANWNQYSPFQKNVWLWTETNRWILEFAAQLPSPKILTIHSEDVFSMKEETIKSLYEFVGTETPSLSKITRLLKRKLNAQKTGSFPTSASWSIEQKAILSDMSSEIAAKLGYNLSQDNE